MKLRLIVLALLLQFALNVIQAQTHQWWADNVKWDGITNYKQYISIKPGKMGPNAFYFSNGLTGTVDTQYTLEVKGQSYFTKGEVTLNPFVSINIPFGKFASLKLSGVPIEYFNTSHQLKTDRKIFWIGYYDQWAAGDLDVLFTGRLKKNPDMSLLIGLKTASGGRLDLARFTDSPQYFFNYAISWGSEKTKYHATTGFTAWQTLDGDHPQDDGWTYAFSVEQSLGKQWKIRPELYGMLAYLKDGDRPMIAKISLNHPFATGKFLFEITRGLVDFPFSGISLGYSKSW